MFRDRLARFAGWRLRAMNHGRLPGRLLIDLGDLPVQVHGQQPGSERYGQYHARVSCRQVRRGTSLTVRLLDSVIFPCVCIAPPTQPSAYGIGHARVLAVPATYLSPRSSASRCSFSKLEASSAISPVVRWTSTTMLSFLGFCGTISHASHRPPFVSTA